MKRVGVALILLSISLFLSAYARQPQDHRYFSLYYNNEKIVVSDKLLRPKWFNSDSHKDFTKDKTVYERAESATSIEKDFPEIFKVLKKIEREVEVPVFDGNINFDPARQQKFSVTNARNGIEMDIEAASREILDALKNKTYADIIIGTREIPHKSEKEVLARIGLRAGYSTRFDDDNTNRSANIGRSAACFDGLILMPGETLSFNRTVGPRTAERGYEEAKIIVDGEFVPGVGGGVCQTSTTLFNAAVLAGLTPIGSCNHSLPISYVPLGRDAMVSSAVDLVIKNNTGAAVYFEAGVENGNRVFFRIFGEKLGARKYKLRTEITERAQEVEVLGTVPAAADLAAHRRVIIDDGYPARSVKTFLETFEGGRLVNQKLLRRSSYKGKKEVVRYEKIPVVIGEIASSAFPAENAPRNDVKNPL